MKSTRSSRGLTGKQTQKTKSPSELELTIIDCSEDKYIETGQDTIILVLQNKKNKVLSNKFTIKLDNYKLFNTEENVNIIKSLYQDSITLDKMGFNVNVGKVVWNQCKNILTDDNTKTLLVYSGDIKNNQLNIQKYKDSAKKNYIHKDGINGPILVVNRGYGKGSYSFSYCLISIEGDYLIENHLICIVPKNDIPREELVNRYNKIINSFSDERTTTFVKMYFGNNAINTTELQFVLPIYN